MMVSTHISTPIGPVVVTGGCGFIRSHTVDSLLQEVAKGTGSTVVLK